MRLLGASNGRQLFYVNGPAPSRWEASLPQAKWVAMPILNSPDKAHAERIARACLDHNAVYVCTLGSSCEMLHDWIDQTVIADTVDAERRGSPLESEGPLMMTTWHHDFDEGVWFALVAADVSNTQVDTVVCIDMSDADQTERLTSLIKAINDGWLPSGEA